MGRDKRKKILRQIETFLKLKPHSLTAHVYWRLGATELANSGISLISLKRAGQWSSLKLAEEYLDHCLPGQRDRMEILHRVFGEEETQQMS